MRTPLAWLNLFHNKARTAVAITGVAFSVLLVFMQLGFKGAVADTATVIFNGLEFDIVLRSPEYLHLADARTVPLGGLWQSRTLPDVEWARPFYVSIHLWRNPNNGEKRNILVMGADPDQMVFSDEEINAQAAELKHPEAVLIDRLTRSEFGPKEGERFSEHDVNVRTEIADQRVRIAGHFALGTGLASDGAVLISDRGFARVFPNLGGDRANLILIKVRKNANIDEVANSLRRVFDTESPDRDVEVKTRKEVEEFELNRWIRETSIGLIFELGVYVAAVVGVAIVYQVLSSDVQSQLPEYATLKAMGYDDHFLAGIIVRQAVALAVFGFLVGLLFAQLAYLYTSYRANIPIEMNRDRIIGVFLLSVVMCTISGLGALRKLRSADPADLF